MYAVTAPLRVYPISEKLSFMLGLFLCARNHFDQTYIDRTRFIGDERNSGGMRRGAQ